MKKLLSIFLFVVSINVSAGVCTQTIDTSACIMSMYNDLGTKISEIDLTQITWFYATPTSIKIHDNTKSLTIQKDCIISPTWANLPTYLDDVRCNNKASKGGIIDTTNIDTSLIQHIQLQQIIDSLSVLINDSTYSLILNNIYSQILRLDTTQIDTALDKKILLDSTQVRILNDSIKVYFTQPLSVYDTTHQSILSEINTLLSVINSRIDTTQIDTSFINYFAELNRNNDTLSSILQELKKIDSVYVINRDTAVVSVVGMKDTLFTYDLDTSVVLTIDSTYYFQLDSIIKLLQKDTIDFEYNTICYRSKIDSGVYNLNSVFDVRNPNIPIYLNFYDVDSTYNLFQLLNGNITGTFPNIANDYVPCERWNEYLSSSKQDTLKTLVFKAQTKRIDGTLDTLYNCKGLSFSVSDNATGNITFYYGDGGQDVFDVANEQLPFWENGSFVEFIGFDASSVAGVLRVNMLGCSQTPDVICAKEKPIVNCATSTPIIICSGWASASGIWSTLSGCWNTGQ